MRRVLLAILAFAILIPGSALAIPEDYLGETLVFMTLRRGEIEPEYFFDIGRVGDEIVRRHSLGIEAGVTDHLMLDGRFTFDQTARDRGFDSGRFEVRYRFYEPGALPVDIAASAEVNSERGAAGDRRSYAVEPRLILSKQLGRIDAALNVSGEIRLRGGGGSQLLSAAALSYAPVGAVRFGSELQYAFREKRASVIPQIWINLPHHLTVKAGYVRGSHRSDERFARVSLEIDF
ncbi:MAG TPA: hypothetical protein VEZ11_05705 [Thermoanaerobaculia bacterium]|nr:hypothetical protein [Thermoanaerobaculia bacterium]